MFFGIAVLGLTYLFWAYYGDLTVQPAGKKPTSGIF